MEIRSTTTNTDEVQDRELAEKFRRRARKRNIIFFVVMNVFIVAMVVLLLAQLLTPKTHSPDDTSITAGEVSSPLLGKAAPNFTLPVLNGNGQQVNLADYKGHPVIVNFWASWCAPCNEEAPLLQSSLPMLQSKGVVLLGIDGGETASDGAKFVQKYGLTYTNLVDTVDGATGISFGITSRPETFFIDKNGKIVARWIGGLDTNGLQKELAKIQVN